MASSLCAKQVLLLRGSRWLINASMAPPVDGRATRKRQQSKAIPKALYAFLLSAVVAAEKFALCLQAVADDTAPAGLALWCHGLDRALETVKGHRATTHSDLKGLVVVVPASVALGHRLASGLFALLEHDSSRHVAQPSPWIDREAA